MGLCAILDEDDFVEALEEFNTINPLRGSIAVDDWWEDDAPPPSTDSPKYYVHLADEEARIIQEVMEAGQIVQYHIIRGSLVGCFGGPDHYLIVDGRPVD